MATNTGKRKCKACKKEFVKKSLLQSYCSPECAPRIKQKPISLKKQGNTPRKIKSVSKTNKWACSDGTKLTSAQVDKYIHQAKEKKIVAMINVFGYVFCEDCKEHGVPEWVNEADLKRIDCSHETSVDECKKSGRTELAFAVPNIRMRCRFHHRKHDKTL